MSALKGREYEPRGQEPRLIYCSAHEPVPDRTADDLKVTPKREAACIPEV